MKDRQAEHEAKVSRIRALPSDGRYRIKHTWIRWSDGSKMKILRVCRCEEHWDQECEHGGPVSKKGE